MILENASLLALGGIAAVVAAGWSHVKNFFTYASSFIIVNVALDDPNVVVVRSYLRTDWSLLPSGLLVYRSRYLNLRGESRTSIVPFRIPANRSVYRRGWQFLFLSGDIENLTISYLRGTVNFDKLLSDAIDTFEARVWSDHDDAIQAQSRFQIHRVMGSEKGAWAMGNRSNSTEDSISPSRGLATAERAGQVWMDQSIDSSFKYERSLWNVTKSEDPFEALYFPEAIETYVERAAQWLSMGDWYSERMIPWRRGWLLFGPGGTGKTSLAKATAQKLKIPIYQFYLATLSDQEFVAQWTNMQTPCIALLEDFDAVFDKRESLTDHKSLTFDCILNQISGVGTTNGVFLIVTTNHLEKIDPAMGVTWGDNEGSKAGISTRPGRIDTVIEVGFLDRKGRESMAGRILKDWPADMQKLVDQSGDQVTPAQFQEMCVAFAFEKLNSHHEDNVVNISNAA